MRLGLINSNFSFDMDKICRREGSCTGLVCIFVCFFFFCFPNRIDLFLSCKCGKMLLLVSDSCITLKRLVWV